MLYGKTKVVVCDDAGDLGHRAAAAVAAVLREALAAREEAVAIFAAAESQITFLDALAAAPDIDWSRVVCFNMDDLWSPGMPAECTCGGITTTHLYNKVHPKRTELIRFDAPDAEKEAQRFEALLRSAGPVDVTCQGIGRSGHIALCEPDQINFASSRWVEVAPLVEESKQQLLADPGFNATGKIPDVGITMTLPALFSARHLFTMVPYASKKAILTRIFGTGTPTTSLPATILRWHDGTLFVDRDSCPDVMP
jgi:glucosamine-6-phosphate deaminase